MFVSDGINGSLFRGRKLCHIHFCIPCLGATADSILEGLYHPREQTGSYESWSSLYIYLKGQCTNNDMPTIIFCRRHYKVKFDLDPGYIFQTGLTISLS